MIKNNLFSNLQHSFVPGKSCQSNLLYMLNVLIHAIVHNFEVDQVYLYFAKASGLVPHRQLIHKFVKYCVVSYYFG